MKPGDASGATESTDSAAGVTPPTSVSTDPGAATETTTTAPTTTTTAAPPTTRVPIDYGQQYETFVAPMNCTLGDYELALDTPLGPDEVFYDDVWRRSRRRCSPSQPGCPSRW